MMRNNPLSGAKVFLPTLAVATFVVLGGCGGQPLFCQQLTE